MALDEDYGGRRLAIKYVNGVERKIDEERQNVRDSEGHVLDHGALWEAVIYLNRKVMRLEEMVDGED